MSSRAGTKPPAGRYQTEEDDGANLINTHVEEVRNKVLTRQNNTYLSVGISRWSPLGPLVTINPNQ